MMYWGIGAVLLVVLVYLIIPNNGTGNAVSGPREYDNFAQCLTDNNFVMYGTEWCPHCKAQKELFGASFDKINYVDCDKQPEVCNAEGVTGYPTWKFNGGVLSGTQSLAVLSIRSGCDLVKDN